MKTMYSALGSVLIIAGCLYSGQSWAQECHTTNTDGKFCACMPTASVEECRKKPANVQALAHNCSVTFLKSALKTQALSTLCSYAANTTVCQQNILAYRSRCH